MFDYQEGHVLADFYTIGDKPRDAYTGGAGGSCPPALSNDLIILVQKCL